MVSLTTSKTSLAVRQLRLILKHIQERNQSRMRLAAEWSLKSKWKILISTILSAQTRDETTIKYSEILYKKYPTLKKLANARIKDIEKIIRPINFHKTKARNILATARIIVRKGIPDKTDDLLKLPGVGRKTANVYLATAYKKPAIGVDTHVAYLSQIIGWTKNKNPHKIEKDLEKLFPKKYWREINFILVRFGRMYKTRKKQAEVLGKIIDSCSA